MVNKYIKSFLLGIQTTMEYRVDFLLNWLCAIFPITIQYFLWTAIFNNSTEKVIYGYTYNQMIVYTVIAGIVSRLMSSTGFEWTVCNDVKSGGLDKFLIKPIGYISHRGCCFFGEKSVQIASLTAFVILVLTTLNHFFGVNIEVLRILIFFVTLILSLIINFLIFFLISTLSFWMTEVWAFFLIAHIVINIVSGGVIPLEVFGPKWQMVFNFLPFKYTIYYPINVLNGKLTFEEIYNGLLIQGGWIILLGIFSKKLWQIGMKKYVAVGG